MQTIGIVGFGRFGEALSSVLDLQGVPWRAYDPAREVPPERKETSLLALTAQCQWIVLAVPIQGMQEVLADLRPGLTGQHLVMDVGSVKVHPCRWLEESLGEEVPHVGTHPLFGPVSLAEGDLPLRMVVCASPKHPTAAEQVSAWFTGMGFEVLQQSPEAHDQVMATTHALTFFLTKGLLDAGCGADLPFTPPSFHAIAKMLETVRGDAGHLFQVIQNLNPFAMTARERLMESLQAIHEELEEAGEAERPSLAIPPPPPELSEARLIIDEVDRVLIHLLARRTEMARRVADVKARSGVPILDPAREAALLESRRAWALESSLDPDTVDAIFKAIMRSSRRIQTQGSTNK